MSSTGSKASRLNFFFDHVRENPLGLELGQLGKNSWRGSGGEGDGPVDDMTGDDASDSDDLLIWFLGHRVEFTCASSVTKNLIFGEGITQTVCHDFEKPAPG